MQLPHERTVEIVTDWMADLGAHDIGMRIQPREGRYELNSKVLLGCASFITFAPKTQRNHTPTDEHSQQAEDLADMLDYRTAKVNTPGRLLTHLC